MIRLFVRYELYGLKKHGLKGLKSSGTDLQWLIGRWVITAFAAAAGTDAELKISVERYIYKLMLPSLLYGLRRKIDSDVKRGVSLRR